MYNYNRADWSRFRSILNNDISLSSSVFSSVDAIDEAVVTLTNALKKARDLAVPKVNSRLVAKPLPIFFFKIDTA